MAVAGGEQCAGGEDRQVDDASGSQFLAIDVATVLPRLTASPTTGMRRRGDGKLPKERTERQFKPPRHRRCHRIAIERDVEFLQIRKILRERPHVGSKGIPAPVLSQRNIDDADLEGVTRMGILYRDRASVNVIADILARPAMNLEVLRQNLKTETVGRQFRLRSRDRVYGDLVAGFYDKDRRQ